MEKVEKYNRPTACCNLERFDTMFADEQDFAEVCEWKNGCGYDIAINDRHYSLTRGEIDAINYLIEHLNED